jgi:hypothetical protein
VGGQRNGRVLDGRPHSAHHPEHRLSLDLRGWLDPSGSKHHGWLGGSVRSTEGDWFQVVYDVEQDGDAWAIAPGACDGCGTVFIGGEAVGEVCNDFSVLRDWEDQPW